MPNYVTQMSKEGGSPFLVRDAQAIADIAAEATARQNAVSAEATARQNAINGLQNEIDDQFGYQIKAFDDYDLYSSGNLGSGNCIVSTNIIPANSFVNGARIKFNRSSVYNGVFYIIDDLTKEVLYKKIIPIRNEWYTCTIDYLCPANCVFAFYGEEIRHRDELAASPEKNIGKYAYSTGLNVAANGGGLNVGDTASITTTSPTVVFAVPVEVLITKDQISVTQKNELKLKIEELSDDTSEEEFKKELQYNIISGLNKETDTHRGVTYTWDGDKCHIEGEATGGKSQYNLFYSQTKLPTGIKKNKKYFIDPDSADDVYLRVYAYRNGVLTTLVDSRTDPLTFKWPDDTDGAVITFEVNENVTVNKTIRPRLYQMEPNTQIITENICEHGPIISFIDDDSGVYAPSIWGEIMQETGIRMGFACVTGYISGQVEPRSATYEQMTVAELRSFYDDGNEVYSHSYSHPAFYESTADDIELECRLSKQWLDGNGFGRTSDIIVYPGGLGAEKKEGQARTRQFYRYGIDTYGGVSDEPIINPYFIHRFNADTATLAELKSKIDEVVSKNGLLVFMNHAFELNKDRENEVAKMISAIEYAQNAGVTILPFGEAIRRIYGWNR